MIGHQLLQLLVLFFELSQPGAALRGGLFRLELGELLLDRINRLQDFKFEPAR